MALLIASPVTHFYNYPVRYHERYFGFNSRGGGRVGVGGSGLEAGRGVFCSRTSCKKYLPAMEARNQTRAGAGPGEKSSNSGSSLLSLDKKLNGQLATDDLEFLPGMELDSEVRDDATPLLYKPFMDHLWMTLTKKAPDFKSLNLEPDFRRQSSNSGAKKSRVFNWLSSASRLRRVRMTYFDGGSALQAFNSLLYPDFEYDVPLLGIDLLSFGTSKILCAIDFTPLTQDPAYLDKYTSQLAPSRAKIAEHCGRMTTRFYDENQFFSKQLIFYRSALGAKDPILEVPNGLLFSTYVEYIDKYLQILQAAEPNVDSLKMSYVASRQNAYNKHSEERDPAIKIFNKHFGEEWSERFTRDFLFRQDIVEKGDDSAVNRTGVPVYQGC